MRRFFKKRKPGRPVITYAFFDAGLGEMAAAAGSGGICRLLLRASGSHDAVVEALKEAWPGHQLRQAPHDFTDLRRQLQAYLEGRLQDFTVPLAPEGTEFRLGVWAAARKIPYGQTVTYGELAASLGMNRSGSRAVGNALGANPLPILIPCHRVLGRDGRLTGYGGGLELKSRLLRIEGALLL